MGIPWILIPAVFPVYIVVHLHRLFVRRQKFPLFADQVSPGQQSGHGGGKLQRCIDKPVPLPQAARLIPAQHQIQPGGTVPAVGPQKRRGPGTLNQSVHRYIDLAALTVDHIAFLRQIQMHHPCQDCHAHGCAAQRQPFRPLPGPSALCRPMDIQHCGGSQFQCQQRQMPMCFRRQPSCLRRKFRVDVHGPAGLFVDPALLLLKPIHPAQRKYHQHLHTRQIEKKPYNPHQRHPFHAEKSQQAHQASRRQIAVLIDIPVTSAFLTESLHPGMLGLLFGNMNSHQYPILIDKNLPYGHLTGPACDQIGKQKRYKQKDSHFITPYPIFCRYIPKRAAFRQIPARTTPETPSVPFLSSGPPQTAVPVPPPASPDSAGHSAAPEIRWRPGGGQW